LLTNREQELAQLETQDQITELQNFQSWLETRENFANKRLLPSFFNMCQTQGVGIEKFTSVNWSSYHFQDFGSQVTRFLPEWKASRPRQEITLLREILSHE
jgi:hypothetical protein